MARRYLPLACIVRHEPAMRAGGVSEVARSPRGFLTAYKRAGGDPARLSPAWRARREAFVTRHSAQMTAKDRRGMTRRRLALIAWAWDPGRGCPISES